MQEFKKNIKEELKLDSTIFDFVLPDGFIDWFEVNGTFYAKQASSISNDLIVNCSTAGNCFQNSQLIALQNKDFNYYEGVLRTIKSKTLTHHGFNIKDQCVIDVTFLNNKGAYVEELKEENYYYFGVQIETDFISKYPSVLTAKYLNNPLLLDYFIYTSKQRLNIALPK